MVETFKITKKTQVPESSKEIQDLKSKTQSERIRQVMFFSDRRRLQEYIKNETANLEKMVEEAGGEANIKDDYKYKRKKELLESVKRDDGVENTKLAVKDMIAKFYNVIREIKYGEPLKQYYKNISAKIFNREMGEKELYDAYVSLDSGNMSEEEILKLADSYTDLLENETANFHKTVETVKLEFISKIKKGVRDGWLPTSVLEKLNRLDSTKFILEEPTFAKGKGWDGSSEEYGLIAISAQYTLPGSEKLLESIISHEFIHEISGLAFVAKTIKAGHFEKTEGARYKVGMQSVNFSNRNESAVLVNGRWINESITMYLNKKLGYDDKGYPGLLDRFLPLMNDLSLGDGSISKGIDEKILFSAYFESWEAENGKKINPKDSEYRKLVDEVNRVYRERFNDPVGWLSFDRGMTQDEYLKS